MAKRRSGSAERRVDAEKLKLAELAALGKLAREIEKSEREDKAAREAYYRITGPK